MRLLITSILVLTTYVSAIQANDPNVALEFRPVADIGQQVSSATGPKGESAIEVRGVESKSTTTVVICNQPAITASEYIVRGRVKYEAVSADGYLELWNDFGDKGAFFSRSLSEFGEMKKLTGTSDWREFALPFHAEPGMKVQRLTLNVVLPGTGKVIVSQPIVSPLSSSSQWWSAHQSGMIGGGLGSLIGILGALIGLTTAWGKSRKLTNTMCGIGLAVCGILLVAGIVALCVQQPWHVYYPLLLVGFIGVTALGPNLRTIARRFEENELRRMNAADAV